MVLRPTFCSGTYINCIVKDSHSNLWTVFKLRQVRSKMIAWEEVKCSRIKGKGNNEKHRTYYCCDSRELFLINYRTRPYYDHECITRDGQVNVPACWLKNNYTPTYMIMLSKTTSHTENFWRETAASISALLWSPKNCADEMAFALENFFLASSVSSIWLK